MNQSYYSREEVRAIIDESLSAYVCPSEVRHYLHGHRERFVQTFARIPRSKEQGELCLDIGGFALTPYWLSKYFGYTVHVYNRHPDSSRGGSTREFSLCGTTVTYESINVDLNGSWPGDNGKYPFVLFAETLEHLNDPLSAMRELNRVCGPDGRVLLTTPNANSILALRRFFMGLPAWVYYPFEPDAGGTRHVFEHTPDTLLDLSKAVGFGIHDFGTEYCYWNDKSEIALFSTFLDSSPSIHGDTLFYSMVKERDGYTKSRRPPILYDAQAFYEEMNWEFERTLERKVKRLEARRYSEHDIFGKLRRVAGGYALRYEELASRESGRKDASPDSFDTVAYLFDSIDREKLPEEKAGPESIPAKRTDPEESFAYLLDCTDRELSVNGDGDCRDISSCLSSGQKELSYFLDSIEREHRIEAENGVHNEESLFTDIDLAYFLDLNAREDPLIGANDGEAEAGPNNKAMRQKDNNIRDVESSFPGIDLAYLLDLNDREPLSKSADDNGENESKNVGNEHESARESDNRHKDESFSQGIDLAYILDLSDREYSFIETCSTGSKPVDHRYQLQTTDDGNIQKAVSSDSDLAYILDHNDREPAAASTINSTTGVPVSTLPDSIATRLSPNLAAYWLDSLERQSASVVPESSNHIQSRLYMNALQYFDTSSRETASVSWISINTYAIRDDVKRVLRRWPLAYKYCRWTKLSIDNPRLAIARLKDILRRYPRFFRTCKKLKATFNHLLYRARRKF